MKKKVIAIFDIGKTNKKFLLFDTDLNIVLQEEAVFAEISDEDDYPCDDVVKLIAWVRSSIERVVLDKVYKITALNFTTYGASLVYLNEEGRRITQLYNYLKPMPANTLNGFYENYGGKKEFSRKTASPALDMLNSGLQIYWLKKENPEIWKQVKHILHLPQFLCYIFTGEIVSEYPSIGCHTAMWDFDTMSYHAWLSTEGISLPQPIDNNTLFPAKIGKNIIPTGIGVHDSSASLVPYLKSMEGHKFMLISTGTWAINMNPFNHEPLTSEELIQDCLCYLSVDKQQVKSSRLFLGYIHDINTQKLGEIYQVDPNKIYTLKVNDKLLAKLVNKNEKIFFPHDNTIKHLADYSRISEFPDYSEAYHQFMLEICQMEANAIKLVYDLRNSTESIYITGGFVKNELFCTLIATLLPDKKVFKAELYNASALGAAMLVNDDTDFKGINIELQQCQSINF